jgi:hypothetical protein
MTIQYPMATSSVMTPTMIPAIASPRPPSPLWAILSRRSDAKPDARYRADAAERQDREHQRPDGHPANAAWRLLRVGRSRARPGLMTGHDCAPFCIEPCLNRLFCPAAAAPFALEVQRAGCTYHWPYRERGDSSHMSRFGSYAWEAFPHAPTFVYGTPPQRDWTVVLRAVPRLSGNADVAVRTASARPASSPGLVARPGLCRLTCMLSRWRARGKVALDAKASGPHVLHWSYFKSCRAMTMRWIWLVPS